MTRQISSNCAIRCIRFLCALMAVTLGSPCASAAHGQIELNLVVSVAVQEDARPQQVVISLKKAAAYRAGLLDGDADKGTPYRFYIDLADTTLSESLPKLHTIAGHPIQRVRIAQNSPTTARVVLDSPVRITRADFQIAQLDNPARIVIVLHASQKMQSAARAIPPQEPRPLLPAPDTAKKGPSRDECVIVVDPGHGGKDPGAIGYGGIREKDTCLALAIRLQEELKSNSQCMVFLTRTTDTFLALDTRSRIANEHSADIFISIHANSHEDVSLTGIETYYLNFSSDETARTVAARENFTTPEKIGDLEMILFDLLQSEKINKSSILAGYVHNSLVENITSKYGDIRNLGVKHAPIRVLIDAEMPCVLIETAFISNPAEARRLQDIAFQRLLARAIHQGMRSFLNGHKTALLR